jgi:putative ABC transport system ATP-binding protein
MLKLVNVCKTFPKQPLPILNNINLELAEGDFCILLGNNGSGKSTLMRCIAGEHSINNGQIIINKQDVTQQDRSPFIASVTQDINAGTIAEMTLLENMVLSQMRTKSSHLHFYRHKQVEISFLIKSLQLGLEYYLNKPMQHLSGGQRQIIATLMAINSAPQILLLDEHTSALDPATQQLLMEYTATNITNHKITTIMVTHKLETAMRYGNRMIILNKGNIVLNVKDKEKHDLTIEEILAIFNN